MFSPLAIILLSSPQAFPYDFQTGPFCRISTLLFPSYPPRKITSLFFPPKQIVPSSIMVVATGDCTVTVSGIVLRT